MIAVQTSTTGMLICSGFAGFFFAAVGPVLAEVCYSITKPHLQEFAYGYIAATAGVGWLLGAPTAGKL